MGQFFSDFRENALAAVDTMYILSEKGSASPNDFIVPAGAQYITAIKIYVSGIAADVVTGTTFAVHLVGLGGQQWWVGPLVSIAGAAATSGGFQFADGMVYQTRIPVGGVSQFSAEAYCHGEDLGTAHLLLVIEYDGVPGQLVDSDYREGDIGAAANTLTSLAGRGTQTTLGNFKTNGRTIAEIIFGAALDPAGDAAAGLVFAPAFSLDGNGLVTNNKPITGVGPSGPTQPDTDVSGNGNCVVNPTRIICGPMGIKTQNGEIIPQAQNIESINASHAILGLCYK